MGNDSYQINLIFPGKKNSEVWRELMCCDPGTFHIEVTAGEAPFCGKRPTATQKLFRYSKANQKGLWTFRSIFKHKTIYMKANCGGGKSSLIDEGLGQLYREGRLFSVIWLSSKRKHAVNIREKVLALVFLLRVT